MTDYAATTLDQVRDALSCVPADERDIWIRMGMAVKAEFGDSGFDVWDSWSQDGKNYKSKTAKVTWKSFKGAAIKIGTLFKVAVSYGYVFPKEDISEEEKSRRAENAERRRAENEKRWKLEKKEEKEWHKRVAVVSETLWRTHLSDSGTSPYLDKKQVKAWGIKFATHGVVILTLETEKRIEIIFGREAISAFFETRDQLDPETTSFKYIKKGDIAIPVRDIKRKLWNLQIIYRGGEKSFLSNGKKQGCFHILGSVIEGGKILEAEGYATSATLHEAMQWPVAMAFDTSNLKPVAQALHKHYPAIPIVLCADNDHKTKGNPGITKATEAAAAVDGCVVVPAFKDIEEVSP